MWTSRNRLMMFILSSLQYLSIVNICRSEFLKIFWNRNQKLLEIPTTSDSQFHVSWRDCRQSNCSWTYQHGDSRLFLLSTTSEAQTRGSWRIRAFHRSCRSIFQRRSEQCLVHLILFLLIFIFYLTAADSSICVTFLCDVNFSFFAKVFMLVFCLWQFFKIE